MPAQWPIFINKVSAKLASLSSSSIDEFAVFLAGEYFNSVKTSQTMYGNLHQSGQKPVLEEGFKKAFKKIYDEETVEFNSKSTNSKYADMFEKAPGPDINFDAYCDLEKWTEKNKKKEKLQKFTFYPFFPSTCPNPADEKPVLTGEIDSNLLEEASKPGEPERYITMSIFGFSEGINYRFLYSINGVDQPIEIATDNVLNILAPTQNGSYEYTFKGVYNSDGISLLKEIDKTITLDIKPEGVKVIEERKDPFADKKPRPIIPEMTEEERVKKIALRVLYQNDESIEYSEWVNRLDTGHNAIFGKKVKEEVLQIIGSNLSRFNILKKEYTQNKKININKYNGKTSREEIIFDILKKDKTVTREDLIKRIYTIPKTNKVFNNINEYIFQEEHVDDVNRIPKWIEAADICKFVFINSIDKTIEGYSSLDIRYNFEYTKKNENQKYNSKYLDRIELNRNTKKIILYLQEKNKWYDLLRKWGNSQTGNLEENTQGGDGYEVMAQAIIDYWKSTAVQPFKPAPPIPPCTSVPPLGGKYAPISYGNKSTLASDLRKAWNTGKRFKVQSLTPIASKDVASAVAVSCAKHLLGVKFLYLGGLIIPSSPPIPMVGISPTTF